jgi:hypothetical protein
MKTKLKKGDWVTHDSADGRAVRCVHSVNDNGFILFYDQVEAPVHVDDGNIEKMEDESIT